MTRPPRAGPPPPGPHTRGKARRGTTPPPPPPRGPLAPGHERAVQAEQDHHADDRADEAAEVELVVVADAEQAGEDEEPDERAGQSEQDGGEEAHRIAAGHEQPAEEPGDDAEDD